MLDLPKSTIIDTRLYPLLSTLTSLEEGVALVFAQENGLAVVKPSAGTSGEVFAGCANHRRFMPTTNNAVVTTTVPASSPYTITLAKTPTAAGQIKVYLNGAAATQGSVATGVYSVSGSTLTFAVGDAGKTALIIYTYNLTQAEANLLFGGEVMGSNVMTGVGVTAISQGTVFTDKFVMSDSWETTSGPVYVAASGKFTLTAGSATALDAIVAATPGVSGGFLGLNLKP